jgi:hypothetical protein
VNNPPTLVNLTKKQLRQHSYNTLYTQNKQPWSKDEDQTIINEYADCDIKEFCKKLKRTIDSVTSRAYFLKVKKNKVHNYMKYELNKDYFKKIDTKRKAYWYGFLWADGSMYKNFFELALNEKDLYAIEQFKQDIESTHPIIDLKNNNCYSLRFNSKTFAEHLRAINITARKSYTHLIPIISDEYFINFLMGIFDGDGTFTRSIGITTNENVAIWLQTKLLDLYNIKASIYNIKGTIAKKLSINKIADNLFLLEKMYNNNDFYLKRKKHKYDKFKNNRNIA